MKKMLLLAAVLMSTGFSFAQTMLEIPVEGKFHAMSENGKWMVIQINSGEMGVYNTETGDYKTYSSMSNSYNLGIGNMVTNDGFVVGDLSDVAAILDVENDTWTELPIKEGDENHRTHANCINHSREYIVGYVSTNYEMGKTSIRPVIWTMGSDGTYGVYEELPYPEVDFSGAAPKYVLPQCISDDGSVIAAQIVGQDNYCLPLVYRKAADGTWTYEMYDKNLLEPGAVVPEYPADYPEQPDQYDYLTAEGYAAYAQDSTEYSDSVYAYRSGLSSEYPSYYPYPEYYMEADKLAEYQSDYAQWEADYNAYYDKLNEYRMFLMEDVNQKFYTQNGVWLSPNGKYYSATNTDWTTGTAGNSVLFTIGDEMERKENEDGLRGFCVTNDGDFFVSDWITAYVYPAGGSERVTLIDWLRSNGDTEAADWLAERGTGTVICSGDGRVISGYYKDVSDYKSWIIKLDGISTGITDVETDADGNACVKVYDLQGRFVAEGPEGEVTKGLKRGVYIVGNRKVVVR